MTSLDARLRGSSPLPGRHDHGGAEQGPGDRQPGARQAAGPARAGRGRAGRRQPEADCPDCAWQQDLDDAEWNFGARGETAVQRLDRNFVELLQELRVAQTGVQILVAFLLGLAFTPRFKELSAAQEGLYLVTLVVSASAAALLIAPVTYHRMVFRRRLKAQLVAVTHRFALVGLTLLLTALIGSVALAASLVIGDWAVLLAGVLAVAFAGVWFAVPLRDRARHTHHAGEPQRSQMLPD